MQLENIINRAEHYFVEVVESGSDQALFIAGYVQGHFSLALAQLQACEQKSASQLKNLLNANLEQAFAAKELETTDQLQCQELVERLFAD